MAILCNGALVSLTKLFSILSFFFELKIFLKFFPLVSLIDRGVIIISNPLLADEVNKFFERPNLLFSLKPSSDI